MPEIGSSGLMSGDGKRGVGLRPPSYRAHPRLYRLGHRAVADGAPQRLGKGLRSKVFGRREITLRTEMRVQLFRLFEA